MQKKDIEQKKYIKINENFENLEDIEIYNDLIKKFNFIKLQGDLNYHESIKTLDVNCEIEVSFDAIDSRDGNLIKDNVETYEWVEQYSFDNNEFNPDNNIVLGDEFDLLEYAIEQIVLNIPINFTKNYDKIELVNEYGSYFEEDTYDSFKENKMDSRWDKLKEFNFNNDKE